MSAEKPTILIVHGAWHTPKHYTKLTKVLGDMGYEVHCPIHPTVNEARPPTASLAEDTSNIRSYAEDLVNQGKNVVALMHSYGGQVGTNALYGLGTKERSEKGLPGGVSRLIYLSAHALAIGQSMVDKVKEMGHEALIPLVFDIAEDMTIVIRDCKAFLFGQQTDYPEEEMQAYISDLKLWNGQAMYDPLSQCAWKEIPASFIVTLNDTAILEPYQRASIEMMKREGIEVEAFDLASGHCPNLTAADEVASLVNKIVSRAQ
ncbi:Alpha/beta hydrolase fold-1 [Stachybotrys elegans]|uniref:Alpha/beta hydrolase fold-1 n=1 Tax=Stachybotrys elegans TaxID=80388 RepID=A0A8K0SXI6_9HYPO|nr:Alpha/beta hydrolase fold-1 [Stachybotrys elegans]